MTTWSSISPIARASPPLHGIAKSLVVDCSDANGLPDPLGDLRALDVLERAAALQHRVRQEADQVGKHEQVGDVAGRDRAVAVEPVPGRGVERGHEHGVLGRDAGRHCLAHHPVDVARVGDVLGVAIVRAERDAPGPVLLDEREERPQVPRHRRLADEQPHSYADALAAFLDRQRLMIRVDARGRVRLQVAPHEPGCVAVDVLRTLDRELRELSLRAGDDAREVHHLAETEDPSPPHQRLEIARRQSAAWRLEGRGGHARRRHEVDVELEIRRRVEEPVHAVDAEDVRDLVRVGDDSRRARAGARGARTRRP